MNPVKKSGSHNEIRIPFGDPLVVGQIQCPVVIADETVMRGRGGNKGLVSGSGNLDVILNNLNVVGILSLKRACEFHRGTVVGGAHTVMDYKNDFMGNSYSLEGCNRFCEGGFFTGFHKKGDTVAFGITDSRRESNKQEEGECHKGISGCGALYECFLTYSRE